MIYLILSTKGVSRRQIIYTIREEWKGKTTP